MTSKKLPNYPTLENAPEKLRSARQVVPEDFPSIILDFANYMAEIARVNPRYKHKFIVDTLYLLACEARDNIQAETNGYLVTVPVPETLKGKMPEILDNIEAFYVLVEKISSKKFSKKFRAFSLIGDN